MKVILEGPDGVGKTTLADKLARYYGCDILHLIGQGSKLHEDYIAKANLNNIISDRSFLSEIPYSIAHNRESKVSLTEAETLLDYYRARGWKFLILNASDKCLSERLNIRGDEDEANIEKINHIALMYRMLSYFYNIPMIDVEHTTFEDVIKTLEGSHE